MTDIYERLRELQQLAEADKPFGYVPDIFRCAADEIERLQGDVEYWKHNTGLLPLRAEIERLYDDIAQLHLANRQLAVEVHRLGGSVTEIIQCPSP